MIRLGLMYFDAGMMWISEETEKKRRCNERKDEGEGELNSNLFVSKVGG